MYCKTITSHDLDGNEIKGQYYFHMYKNEMVKYLSTNGDYTIDKLIEKMLRESKAKDMITMFEQLIAMSYGERSMDNKRFIKDPEKTKEFMQSEAYDVMFMELLSDGNKATEFINGIIPSDWADDMTKVMKDNPEAIPDNLREFVPGNLMNGVPKK